MNAKAAGDLRRRPEREADMPFLFALFSAVQGASLASLEPTLRTMLLRQSFAGQRATYRTRYPDAHFDVLECDEAAIGRLVLDEAADMVTLVDVALLSEWRGQGIGSRLVRKICDKARDDGRPVRLSVVAANVAAQRFYGRLGFVPVGATATDVTMQCG